MKLIFVFLSNSPKELIYDMPVIQIIPVEANKLKLKDSLRTPVYVTQNRKNSMGVGLVFEADLATDDHPSHWVSASPSTRLIILLFLSNFPDIARSVPRSQRRLLRTPLFSIPINPENPGPHSKDGLL